MIHLGSLGYDPVTGLFYRYGKVIGGNGEYIKIKYDGRCIRGQTLAWFMVYGVWSERIDHKNENKRDNRIDNLREATNTQNCANSTRMKKNNEFGWKGVRPYHNKFTAYIQLDGKKQYIGLYDTPDQAHEAYKAKHREHYGEFSCH